MSSVGDSFPVDLGARAGQPHARHGPEYLAMLFSNMATLVLVRALSDAYSALGNMSNVLASSTWFTQPKTVCRHGLAQGGRTTGYRDVALSVFDAQSGSPSKDRHHRLQNNQHVARLWEKSLPVSSFPTVSSFASSILVPACAPSIRDQHRLLAPCLLMPAGQQ